MTAALLPPDTLCGIFSCVERRVVSRELCRVCRAWQCASVDARLWGALDLGDGCVTHDEAVLYDLPRWYGEARLSVLESLVLPVPSHTAHYSVVQVLDSLSHARGLHRLRVVCITGCGEVDRQCLEAFSTATPGVEVFLAGALFDDDVMSVRQRVARRGRAQSDALRLFADGGGRLRLPAAGDGDGDGDNTDSNKDPQQRRRIASKRLRTRAAMWRCVTDVCLEEPATKRRRLKIEASSPTTMGHLSTPVVLPILGTWGGLQVIDLAGWGVTDVCLEAMPQAVPRLTHLSLEGCTRITPRGLAHLARAPALEVLGLSRVLTSPSLWRGVAQSPPPKLAVLFAARCHLHRAALQELCRRAAATLRRVCLPRVSTPTGVDVDAFYADYIPPAVDIVQDPHTAGTLFAEAFGYADAVRARG